MIHELGPALLYDAPVRGAIVPVCALVSAWLYRHGRRGDAARVGAAALAFAVGLGMAYGLFAALIAASASTSGALAWLPAGITAVTALDAAGALLGNALLVWTYAWPAGEEGEEAG